MLKEKIKHKMLKIFIDVNNIVELRSSRSETRIRKFKFYQGQLQVIYLIKHSEGQVKIK